MSHHPSTVHNVAANNNVRARLQAQTVGTLTTRQQLGQQVGLLPWKPAKKQRPTPIMAKKRLAWCTQHRHHSVDCLHKVLLSDESSFPEFRTIKTFVRRQKNKKHSARYTVPTVKLPPSVMIWGCFAGNGRGSFHFLPKGTTVRQSEY